MYLGTWDDEDPLRLDTRSATGSIVGAVSPRMTVCARSLLLPFLFVVPSRRASCGRPRYIVRAGISPQPVDPWLELRCDSPCLEASSTSVLLCVPSRRTNPLLREWHLTDRDSRDRVSTRLRSGSRPSFLPGREGAGARQSRCRAAVAAMPTAADRCCRSLPSSVRTRVDVQVGLAQEAQSPHLRCASARSLARLLALPATTGRDAGRTAFELLLVAHAARFAESRRGEAHDAD